MKRYINIFFTALKLGCIAFGGPAAHIGFFKEEYVNKKNWLSDERFAELMAVSQFLPGPGSSQLGAAIGYSHGGLLGGFLAWLGFTLPSALILICLAMGINSVGIEQLLWLKSVAIIALAVVANAILSMQKKLCDTGKKRVIAMLSLLVLAAFSKSWTQPLIVLMGGVIGVFLFEKTKDTKEVNVLDYKKSCFFALGSIISIILITYSLSLFEPTQALAGIFKSGSLVFGGGHVVLPLLGAELLETQRISELDFLAGYGVTQAVPGPVFTFGGYLGSKMALLGSPLLGGLAGVTALFLPGMLLMIGFVPVWDAIKSIQWVKSFLIGTNAAVVGLLVYALITMYSKSNIEQWWEFAILISAFTVLWKRLLPPWAVILLGGAIGYFLY